MRLPMRRNSRAYASLADKHVRAPVGFALRHGQAVLHMFNFWSLRSELQVPKLTL